jgi:hypothetical protein
MSLPVGGNSGGSNSAGPMPPAGTVSLPGRPVTPLTAVTRRILLAVLLPAASTVIVYLGRGDRLILVSSPQPPASPR